MVFEVTGTGESFKANFALERSVAGVGTVMDDQSARAREQFVAHVAFQGFFLAGHHVRFLMVLEVTGTGERFQADVAFVRPIARVQSVVDQQALGAGEQFVADVALQRFLGAHRRMGLLVVLAVAGAGERFETHVALERPVAGVRPIVDGQAAHAGEQLVAHVALQWFGVVREMMGSLMVQYAVGT